jgi:type IV pilus assembly protein PilV
MKNSIKNNKGFTLIELMIAIVIFSIGLLAMAQLQMFSIRYNSEAQRMSEATTLAQGKMEDLMSLDYADTDLDNGDHTDPNNANIKWSITVNPEVTGSTTETKSITVTADWNSRGTTKDVTLDSIRADLD